MARIFFCANLVAGARASGPNRGDNMASNSPRLNIPAFGGIYATLSPYAELLLRGGLGAILIVHALQKFLS